MIQTIQKLINNLERFSVNRVMSEINSLPENTDKIESYIKSRLLKDGTTSTGYKLRTDTSKRQGTFAYAIRTEQIKGLSTHVNLRDTGTFYNSIEAIGKPDGSIEIKANFEKTDSHIYQNFLKQFNSEKDFEDDILNLNDNELKEYVLKDFLLELEKEVNKLLNV